MKMCDLCNDETAAHHESYVLARIVSHHRQVRQGLVSQERKDTWVYEHAGDISVSVCQGCVQAKQLNYLAFGLPVLLIVLGIVIFAVMKLDQPLLEGHGKEISFGIGISIVILYFGLCRYNSCRDELLLRAARKSLNISDSKKRQNEYTIMTRDKWLSITRVRK